MAVDPSAPALRFDAISHRFGRNLVIDRISLDIAEGEVVCLLGPSGCGKTTLLRLAAGLEEVQAGRVILAGRTVGGGGADVPPERRRAGLVFQDFTLFPHLDLAANIAFGLDSANAIDRALEWLDRVGLRHRAHDYPRRLSGGEQQRVALVRALAPGPRLMLMDEPFSNLDTVLRQQLRREALALLRESGAATLLVTHDPDEAMEMADRLALMRAGRLIQVGPPRSLYLDPADRFTATFLGPANLLACRAQTGQAMTPFGPVPAGGIANGAEAWAMIRPEAVRLAPAGVPARIIEARHVGGTAHIRLALESGEELLVHNLAADLPRNGERVTVLVEPGAIRLLTA